MFKLLLAELRYYKYSIIIEYCLYLGLFILAMLDESNNYVDIFSFMISSFIVFFIMLTITCIPSVVEKRERFYTLLPVSVKMIGKLNLLSIILANASIFILWIIIYLTKYVQQEPGLIWTMISFSMHIFIVFGLIATISTIIVQKSIVMLLIFLIFSNRIRAECFSSMLAYYPVIPFVDI